MKQIISASRRTDIPAFYSEWFVNRLKQEEVYVRNPYNGKWSRISLSPENIHSIVFISKNYSSLIPCLPDIEKATPRLLFHFTITGIPRDLEMNVPPYDKTVEDFITLSRRYSPEQMIWRFDPVCLTDRLPFSFYERRFVEIASLLEGSCFRCFISFAKKYKKTLANVERYSTHRFAGVSPEEEREYAYRLGSLAERFGMMLYACCNDHLLSDRVAKASCIDGEYLARLFGDQDLNMKPAPTRSGCGCTRSVDIGAYDTCPHGCLYCYANSDKEVSERNHSGHQVEWNALGENAEEESRPERNDTTRLHILPFNTY